jgi:putative oxidoreductase
MAVTKFNERTALQSGLLTLLRIFTGIVLIYKSYNFIRDAAVAKTKIEQTGIGVFTENSEILALVITYLGLLCGLLIALGLFTRIAAVIQIPILIVAVFFVNFRNIESNVFEFILSMIILILLILFALKGGGPFSANEYFRSGEPVEMKPKNQM